MELKLYNTMTRKIEPFASLKEKEVGMYCCGPTVYNYAHIGNLRTYIFEDILKRVLYSAGYSVKHVMNITDVGHLTGDGDEGEDKIEKASRETGKSVWDIAEFYTNAFFRDFDELNNIRPDVVCKATDHIEQMISLIKRLEEKGYTYTANGNVYFSIDAYPEYGKLARLKLDELKSGARIDVDANKRNPKDFVLWFTKSKFENQAMTWDSPWGRGYPGWHIECSAMSMYYLGESFDIHCGGIDAIPVHHTNEIAQSEAATGKKWVNYWLHGEFLLTDKGKMSKSSGEFLTLSYLKEKGFSPLDYRYFCLGAHYRSQLQFSMEALAAARAARLNLNERIKEMGKDTAEIRSDIAKSYLDEFNSYLYDDLSMSRALSVLWAVVKNPKIENPVKRYILRDMDRVLGLDLLKDDDEEDSDAVDAHLRELLKERTEAKKNKDWTRADLIRKEIENAGFAVKDTPEGPVLVKIVK